MEKGDGQDAQLEKDHLEYRRIVRLNLLAVAKQFSISRVRRIFEDDLRLYHDISAFAAKYPDADQRAQELIHLAQSEKQKRIDRREWKSKVERIGPGLLDLMFGPAGAIDEEDSMPNPDRCKSKHHDGFWTNRFGDDDPKHGSARPR